MLSRVLARLPVNLVGAALAIRLIDEWWSYLPAGIVEPLRRDLDVSYAGSGWLLALLGIGALVGAPLGLLVDHVDRRLLATAASASLCVGLVLFATGRSFVVLAVASTVLGGVPAIS